MTQTAGNRDPWIRRYHPAPGSDIQLVCLPHAGGSASFFLPVAKALSPAVDVLAVQYPGRQDRRREANIDNISDLADGVYTALRPFMDRPLAIFGHSMGSVLGYEVGLRMRRDGLPAPVRLFASGRRAPSRVRQEYVHQRDDEGILAELQSLSGTDSSIFSDPEMVKLIMPAVRSDYRAIETYRCQPGQQLTCPITVLVGDSDPMTTVDEARAWNEHTTGPVDLRVFSGGHFYLTEYADQVTGIVSQQLAAASLAPKPA